MLQVFKVDFLVFLEHPKPFCGVAPKLLNEFGVEGLEFGLEQTVFFDSDDVVGDDCVKDEVDQVQIGELMVTDDCGCFHGF